MGDDPRSPRDFGTNGRYGDFVRSAIHERYPNTWLGVGNLQFGGPLDANASPRNFWLMRQRDIPGAHVSVAAVSSVLEAAGSASIPVTLTTADGAPTPIPATVAYATCPGTAAPVTDYASQSGTLAFPAGTPSGTTQIVSIAIVDDTGDEGDETFALDLSSPLSATIDEGSHTVTILDNEPKAISIADAAVIEGNAGDTTFAFPVRLSNASGLTVSIDYQTADGTASAGSDYVASSGHLSFAPGTIAQPITVTVNGDTAVEPHESMLVKLSNATNGAPTRTEAVGTILDDDARLAFHSVPPCRVADTRDPPGLRGGPALLPSSDRSFLVAGTCNVPATARAISLNVTMTNAAAAGNLRLHPGLTAVPPSSSINYVAGHTRANNAIVTLGPAGELAVFCGQPSGNVNVILDVNGYFE